MPVLTTRHTDWFSLIDGDIYSVAQLSGDATMHGVELMTTDGDAAITFKLTPLLAKQLADQMHRLATIVEHRLDDAGMAL